MRRRLKIPVLLILLACLAGKEMPAQSRSWIRVKSAGFTLIGDADEKELKRVAWRLEQFRAAVLKLLNGRQDAAGPITVIVFKNESSYREYKPLYQGRPTSVTGYFQASDDKSYIALASRSREGDLYPVIFHEYVHVLTSSFQRPLPSWVNEGLAEYFSNFQLNRREDRVTIGSPIQSHIQMLASRELMPLDELIAIDESSPTYNELDRKRIFYAQSWALVHFLLLGDGGRRQKSFYEFIENRTPERPAADQFREAFKAEPAEIEAALRSYVKRGSYESEQIDLGARLAFDESIQAEPLAPAELQTYLGDLLWRIKRPGDAENHFARALELDPDSAFAHKTIGILYFRAQRFSEALRRLERAVALDGDDYLSQYYYGASLQWEQVDESRYVSGFSNESVPKMRGALERAIALNPDFPDSYKQLAFMYLTLDRDLDEAVRLLEKSLELAPDRDDFAYTLAQVRLRRKEYAAARRILDRITRKRKPSEVYDNAVRLRSVVDSIEERLAQVKAEEAARNATGTAKDDEPPPPRPEPGKRFHGDQIRGMLTRIDCNDDGTTLSVRSDGRIYRFYSPKSNPLIFMRYTPEVPTEITCGAALSERPVIVTYRKSTNPRSRFEGEPIGVEFLKKE